MDAASSHEPAVLSTAAQLEGVRAALAEQMSAIDSDMQRWRTQVRTSTVISRADMQHF